MNDVYILNKNLKPIGIADNFKSLIWVNRYNELGDCEVYIEATVDNFRLFKKGNYIFRIDDEMICQIVKIELETNSETGNYLIITGVDVKKFLDQRIIFGTSATNGNVEEYLRELVDKSLCNPVISVRRLNKENGEKLFYLGEKANFDEITSEQNSYTNIGELIREKCKKYNWGYKVILENDNLYFNLYKGVDRSNNVIFSDNYENLKSTKYMEDDTNLGNVALVAGEGEGSERIRKISGSSSSVERYEVYVDAKDISKTIKWEELKELYPLKDDGGKGSIEIKTNSDGTEEYVYKMESINVQVVDNSQLNEMKIEYPEGEEITINKKLYYKIDNIEIADLPSENLNDNNDVILRDIIYNVYLLNRGYEKIAEYGTEVSFEGSIEPNVTFKYKKDYFLGDEVTVENEYGISVKARIVEIKEIDDDNGYSIEPKFEYLEVE